MTTPMIVAGTTGETRIHCQFWGEWKTPSGDIRMVDFAQMDDGDFGLRINADCPREWLNTIWVSYLQVLSGLVPTATHTITFSFNANNPTLTAITPPPAAVDQLVFEIEGLTS